MAKSKKNSKIGNRFLLNRNSLSSHQDQNSHQRTAAQSTSQSKKPKDRAARKTITPLGRDSIFFYSRNTIEAALKNHERECLRLFVHDKSESAAKKLIAIRPDINVENIADASVFDTLVSKDSPHQGLILEVRPLPTLNITDMAPTNAKASIILMLDQVSDPHNVGACLRNAAALGAKALITQDRHTPHETGVLARAAAGALDVLPWLRVTNITQTLEQLKTMGYWTVGLDGTAETSITDVTLGDNIVIILGSEGSGMRPLTRRNCDVLTKIPMTGLVESLNISNAASIALFLLKKP